MFASSSFTDKEQQWLARMGSLRDIIRQELVARQLAYHLHTSSLRILDIGCGQGTQVLRLAGAGHEVVGLDPSQEMLAQLKEKLTEERELQERVQLFDAGIEDAVERLGINAFDVVCCHGVLMYFDDPKPALDTISELLRPNGLDSILVRNGDALAMRPGLRSQWAKSLKAFEATTYVNELGADARADKREDFTRLLRSNRLDVLDWYGVRVFNDAVSVDAPIPDSEEFSLLLEAEETAGRTDPYRQVASLTHFVCVRN